MDIGVLAGSENAGKRIEVYDQHGRLLLADVLDAAGYHSLPFIEGVKFLDVRIGGFPYFVVGMLTVS